MTKFDIRPVPPMAENLIKPETQERVGRYSDLRKKQDARAAMQLHNILKPARKPAKIEVTSMSHVSYIRPIPVTPESGRKLNFEVLARMGGSRTQREKLAKRKGKAA